MNGLVFVQFSMLIVFCAVLAGLDQYWAIMHSPSRNWCLMSVDRYPELPPGGPAWFITVRTYAGSRRVWCNKLLWGLKIGSWVVAVAWRQQRVSAQRLVCVLPHVGQFLGCGGG